MDIKALLFLLLVALAASEKTRYDNQHLVRMTLSSERQVRAIRAFVKATGLTFLEEPNTHEPAPVLVQREKMPEFFLAASRLGISFETVTENFQSWIDEETVAGPNEPLSWDKYYKLDQIYSWLDDLIREFPNLVSGFSIGRSYEGRDLRGIRIESRRENPWIFIEANTHAREWIASASATYVLNQLLNGNDTDSRNLRETINWEILPVANPDGFVFSHENERLWRKTRSPNNGSSCLGTDPNRNFEFKWNTGGASNDPCSLTYAGPRPASEIEVAALSNHINKDPRKYTAYIDFHSYSQLLMYPYACKNVSRIRNENEHLQVGQEMVDAIKSRYGTTYKLGDILGILYESSGCSIDWVKGVHDVPFVWLYEMRDTGRYGFTLPADQILPNSEETWDSIVAFVKGSRKLGYFPQN